jgi:hypothetical protein
MFNLSIRLLLGRHRVRVIPIILRACDWQDAPFGNLQALPKDAKPVTSWSNRDEAFLCVEQGIRETVEELWTRRMHKLKNQIYEFENQFEQAEARKQQAKPLKIELENEFANAEAIKQQMDRWKILEDTQTKIFEIQQDITVNKAKAADKMYNKWDKYLKRLARLLSP